MWRCVNTKTRPTLPHFISLRIAEDYSCSVYHMRPTAGSKSNRLRGKLIFGTVSEQELKGDGVPVLLQSNPDSCSVNYRNVSSGF